jgi:HAD superfamily hydrolase (TIGR01484 family)
MGKLYFLFDLDGTLAVSKSSIDQQMKDLLTSILQDKHPHSRTICVISGGKFEQFKEQLIDKLENPELFSRLHLFPTCGTAYYKWNGLNDEFDSEGNPLGKWEAVYEHTLSEEQKTIIFQAFDIALKKTNYGEETTYGKIIEDRSTQITFSALGQEAPIELKKNWDPSGLRRRQIKIELDQLLPDFEVRIGGTTSIDVTQQGIDKGFAIRAIEEHLFADRADMIFFGDALEPGGNDHAVYQAGVECVPVDDPMDCIWKVKLHL